MRGPGVPPSLAAGTGLANRKEEPHRSLAKGDPGSKLGAKAEERVHFSLLGCWRLRGAGVSRVYCLVGALRKQIWEIMCFCFFLLEMYDADNREY